jgi:hypothetical protein
MESATPQQVGKRVWDIAQAMADEREERAQHPML